MASVVIVVLAFLHRRRPPRELVIYALLLLVVPLGKAPGWLYAQYYQVGMSDWGSTWRDLSYPRYVRVRLFWNEHCVARAHVTIWRWARSALRPRMGGLRVGTWLLAYRAT